MTFFPYQGITAGRHGTGQITVTSFSVQSSGLDYWLQRLKKFSVKVTEPKIRFENELFISFEDPDGLALELVFNTNDHREGYSHHHIPMEYAIKGIYGVTLSEKGFESTAGILLEVLDHQLIDQKNSRFRFSASGGAGDFIDVLCVPEALRGLQGGGTIHHVAFATHDDNTQLEVRDRLTCKSMDVTPVLDRLYFKSIYFREPGGILFEIATISSGFGVDDHPAHPDKITR